MIKIGFVTPSISRESGGIFEIQKELCRELTRYATVSVFSGVDRHSRDDIDHWKPLVPKLFQHIGPQAFRYSPAMENSVLGSDCDILHLHVLWMATSITTSRWKIRRGREFVVTINGMLEPWALKNSKVKKSIAWWGYEKRNLSLAACLCVNTSDELKSVRSLGIKNPIAVIPNGVRLPASEADDPHMDRGASGKRKLLYVGRIHPKKGLRNLIEAFGKLTKAEPGRIDAWQLQIVGWDQSSHESELKRLAKEVGLLAWSNVDATTQDTECNVCFLGPKFGAEKSTLLRECDAFILPSFSEGFPMSVLEAWSYQKPVLMTPQCNMQIGFECGAAMQVEPNVESIALGISRMMSMQQADLVKMGENGRRLVEEAFSWPIVAKQVCDLSEWVVGGGQAPSFVDFV